MMEPSRNADSLNKLLHIARVKAQAARADIADIATARQAAEACLLSLEQKSVDPDAKEAVEGLRARRLNLQTTVITLSGAEAAARSRLQESEDEMKKLENLLRTETSGDQTQAPQSIVA